MLSQYEEWWARDRKQIVADFKMAFLKIEPKLPYSCKKMLLAHYASPGMAMSAEHLAIAAGYGKKFKTANLHYGSLAKRISGVVGLPPHPVARTYMLAEWRGEQKDENGHGQWILYDEVAQAIEELGWANIKSNASQQDFPIPLGVEKPKEMVSQTIQRERDPLVRDWVLRAAHGICECCEQEAPFELNDGLPYLEVHHIRHLANEGSDTVSNTVALCPNCHRELHHGKHKDELVENLYACVPRLKRE